ncbi:MAG: hypothetical protein JWP38_2249 [Herbaspirillum sp.]|jgi:hypothetical protein|nr:hypothetical protein [Herbaspirillum sp.]
MNIKHLVAAVALLATTGAVMADSFDESPAPVAASGKTRAEVKAELAQARTDGTMPFTYNDTYPVTPATPTTVSRQQVRTELAKAVQSGELEHRQESLGS